MGERLPEVDGTYVTKTNLADLLVLEYEKGEWASTCIKKQAAIELLTSLLKEKEDEIEYLRQILRESGTFFRNELTEEARKTFDSIDGALDRKQK